MPVTPDLALPSAPVAAAASPVPAKPTLAGLPRAALAEFLRGQGVPEKEIRMRVGQIWHWLYVRGATGFDEMTNVAKTLRALLDASATLARPEIVREQVSVDGTRKWVLRLPSRTAYDKGAEVECVYIPEKDRGTLCVSSQVGCTLNCSFCHTGTQKLVRNLEVSEIVGQVLVARDRLGDYPGRAPPEGAFVPDDGGRLVSNIVFMGMGEPLYNEENVRNAIGVLTDPEGLQLSRRRITVSTSGVVPEIARLGAETGAMLAISLHATNDPLRDELVPINRKYPIAELLQACRDYPGVSNARRITFEYVMLKGVNDSLAEARALVKLLRGIPAKINLIPFNPWPGSIYECSDWERIEKFSDLVFSAGYSSPIRTPRGRDILAACGQLKSDTEKMRARARLMLEEQLALGAE
ncbi:MAG: 23S rRNA (adenine(2503)-C(2))-methyltransferase RlmN [Methylobacterium sp.]|nr:23S rRNA (adenine(2503)-C(2))-methyltransferase RlmN [Methylobacterium sp.]MCA3607692.1 23S rRNA (adenine(2503)-C(2))-methyltransferase RlmN [Methylobacterium sp.]MCA3610123.1 23S rRNA (adenine(2503)-C(2))-methyltransferase RlmN [Methylobacterium sp.]MCA3617113.1 23S rRNA (adenine(2503)-C(2))-methyltransferase RlmN [Methylobacterium sp.]MCA3619721.1 23S rRNA (adenine(2503)-C(2))-methyltransferase RlmN [Methylobacterium sp.]